MWIHHSQDSLMLSYICLCVGIFVSAKVARNFFRLFALVIRSLVAAALANARGSLINRTSIN